MTSRSKQLCNWLINDKLLRPLGLRLSFEAGGDALADIQRLLAPEDVHRVIDGGAYKGEFSVSVARAFPAAQIYAFEPHPDSFKLLTTNTAAIPQIHPDNRGLSDVTGFAMMYVNASPLTNSLLPNSADGRAYFSEVNDPRGTETIAVVSLRDFLNEINTSAIDVLKLDLQGNELRALKGLNDAIATVRVIYIEVWFVAIYEGAPLFAELDTYLRGHGFKLHQLYGLVRSPKDGQLLFGDALFVNQSRVGRQH
jgi:FkbM family methyltransferase